MKKILLAIILASCATLGVWSQATLPALHVEGKWLTDEYGSHVVLHGVMDTPNMYFNDYRWGAPWIDGTDYNGSSTTKCLNYFEKVFAGLEAANCDVFRLHLDPAWTNGSVTAAGFTKNAEGKTVDPLGNVVENEADISKFSLQRLRDFMKSLYVPLMQKAMNHGMYVVVRPPGVCPGDLQVGDYYQDYLLTVWDVVSSNETIKEHAGQISLELANEPVRLKDKNGNENASALHDYFQPIVEKIRSNGFTGIIWVPGTGWQSNYTSYATYPITGSNIGYAVHDYVGWYGCSDDNPDATNKINNFHNQVPVVDTYPIIITEIDWSPAKSGTGHYDEHGEWVESNYGTWATGLTSKWGLAYKAMLDHYGNISMTLSGSSCLIDIDEWINKNRLTPAFGGIKEACGKACMDWYAEWKTGIEKKVVATGFSSPITSLDNLLDGGRFVISNGSRLMYFNDNQDAQYGVLGSLPYYGYCYYSLTKIEGLDTDGDGTEDDNLFAINIVNEDGIPYKAPYNLGNKVNITSWGSIFSGSAQKSVAKNYGTDGEYWGLWRINVSDEGFSFRNAGRNLYLKIDGTSSDEVFLKLYGKVVMEEVEIIEKEDNVADGDIFALSKATGYDDVTGLMINGGWTFDEPVSIIDWDYILIATSNTASDASHEIFITDASGRTVRGEGYDGSSAGTGGKLWLDRWNNQNIIRISVDFLRENLGLDVRNIKSLTINGTIAPSCVCLTDYNNTLVNGGYATGGVVRESTEAGRFGTICLPYTAVCAGAEIYSIAGTTANGISLVRADGLMEAGKPYIYLSADINGKNNEGKVINVNFFRADLEKYDVTSPIESNGLIGTFTKTTAPKGDNYYVLNGNKLYYTTGATVTVDANRAYINSFDITNEASGRQFIAFDAVTGVRTPTAGTTADSRLFDLQGREIKIPVRGLVIQRMNDGTIRKTISNQ